MRVLIAILTVCTLTLAGCTAPAGPAPPIPAPPEPASLVASEPASGIIWYPPPSGPGGATLEMPLPITVPGSDFHGEYEKQWAPTVPGPAHPADAASAMVRFVTAQGIVAGELMLPWNGPRNGTMDVTGLPAGDHTLVFTLYGASVAERAGHSLAYHHQVALPEAS